MKQDTFLVLVSLGTNSPTIKEKYVIIKGLGCVIGHRLVNEIYSYRYGDNRMYMVELLAWMGAGEARIRIVNVARVVLFARMH